MAGLSTLLRHEGSADTPCPFTDHGCQALGTRRREDHRRRQLTHETAATDYESSPDEVKTVPYTPLSHPFVERLIGMIRREFLDQALCWNTQDLAQRLNGFRQYYNAHRVHTALDGIAPSGSSGETAIHYAALSNFHWKSHCRGLYHLPVAV